MVSLLATADWLSFALCRTLDLNLKTILFFLVKVIEELLSLAKLVLPTRVWLIKAIEASKVVPTCVVLLTKGRQIIETCKFLLLRLLVTGDWLLIRWSFRWLLWLLQLLVHCVLSAVLVALIVAMEASGWRSLLNYDFIDVAVELRLHLIRAVRYLFCVVVRIPLATHWLDMNGAGPEVTNPHFLHKS